MKFAVHSLKDKRVFIPSTETEGKPEILSKKLTCFALTILLFGLVLASGGCASSPEQSKITLPPKENLERYIQTADHLNQAQKKELARRRPFVGMTLEEANLAMHRESTDSVLPGKAFQAVYVGESGVKYYLYFQDDPPRVVNWSHFSRDEIELMDPDKLRPSPPGLL